MIHPHTIKMKIPYARMAFRLERFPAALRSVLACLRFSFDMDRDKLRDACRQIDDWDAFLWWIRRHLVMPLVYQNLHRGAWGMIPEAVQSTLQNEYRRNSLQSLALAGETVRLIRLLAQNGIPAMPLKGPVLAERVYGNVAGRHAGDIDLLIAPGDVDKADDVLQEEGYRLDNPDILHTPLRKRIITRKSHHHHYFSPGNRVITELHWRLSAKFRLPLYFGRLWSQGDHVSLAGDMLTVISSDHDMIFLCIHGAVHGWAQLKWLCDVAHIQAGYRQNDWTRLLTVCQGLNAARPVIQAAVLAHILFDNPLPDFVLEQAAGNRTISGLVETALRHIGARDRLPKTISEKCAFLLYSAALRNTLRHKIDAANIVHNADDWSTVPLPDLLFFLYFPIRPFLWIKRQGQRKTAGPVTAKPDNPCSTSNHF